LFTHRDLKLAVNERERPDTPEEHAHETSEGLARERARTTNRVREREKKKEGQGRASLVRGAAERKKKDRGTSFVDDEIKDFPVFIRVPRRFLP